MDVRGQIRICEFPAPLDRGNEEFYPGKLCYFLKGRCDEHHMYLDYVGNRTYYAALDVMEKGPL